MHRTSWVTSTLNSLLLWSLLSSIIMRESRLGSYFTLLAIKLVTSNVALTMALHIKTWRFAHQKGKNGRISHTICYHYRLKMCRCHSLITCAILVAVLAWLFRFYPWQWHVRDTDPPPVSYGKLVFSSSLNSHYWCSIILLADPSYFSANSLHSFWCICPLGSEIWVSKV